MYVMTFLSQFLIFIRIDLNLFALMSECFLIVVVSSELDWRGGDKKFCGSLASMDD